MAWIELHQELREHKKMFACAELLNLSKIQMVGTLVCLWLWALDNAQDGSLAGISEKTIARVCEYPEKKAAKLVSALNETGWLDKTGDTLVIHDWYDYAGKLMERRIKDKERKKTKTGKPQEFRRNSNGNPERDNGIPHATVPLPLPYHNHTVTEERENMVDDTGAAEGSRSDGAVFTAFWNAYPENARHRRDEAWEAWKKLNPGQKDAALILEKLEAWKRSKRWTDDGGAFIPLPMNFLDISKGYILGTPPQAAKLAGGTAPGERKLDEDEIAAIRRMMTETEETENESCP